MLTGRYGKRRKIVPGKHVESKVCLKKPTNTPVVEDM
jgi:hypothetical protein